MMNEWGIPTIELWTLTHQYVDKLAKKGEHIPDIAFAGGCILEDQIFKVLAMGAPYVKLVGMARSFLAAAMVGKTIGKRIDEGQVPVYIERFGNTKEDIFISAAALQQQLGKKKFNEVPTGALGVYTYAQRLAQGLRQLMCGSRKFTLDHMTRDDLAALTKEAAGISGITYVMDVDKAEAEKIINSS